MLGMDKSWDVTFRFHLRKRHNNRTLHIKRAMRNLIVAYKNLPTQVRSIINERYPDGYEDDTFEFEVPGKNLIYKALRVTIEEVTYLIKLDTRYKNTDFQLDDEW